MGVDTRIMLPNDVRIRDVANVIGILAGCNSSFATLGKDSIICRVEGVKTIPSFIPEMAEIIIESVKGLIDGENNHYVNFHYEFEEGGRLMIPPSTPFWIAVGIGLCKFFGGKIDYKDCDSKSCDRTFKRIRKKNNPDDGKAWENFQLEMGAIKPLTIEDMKKVQKYSAYPEKLKEMC